MEVEEQRTGSAEDLLDKDGFKIHDMMFSNRDLIQCLVLCSSSTVLNILSPEQVRAIMITIDHKERNITADAMTYNRKFAVRLKNDNPGVKMNIYLNDPENENRTVFLLSTGFLLDNFEIREGYHDFLLDEESSFVYLEGRDIESLTVPDAELI